MADCFHAGLIRSRSVFSAHDEMRIALARKGRALGFSLIEIKTLVRGMKSLLMLTGALTASFVALEIVDPATIEAIAEIRSFAQ